MTIEELKARLAELQTEATTIQNTADNEKRDLTKEEQEKLEGVFAEFEKTEKDIERRTRLQAITERTTASAGRRAAPNPVIVDNDDGSVVEVSRVDAARSTAAGRARWGWQQFGDFVVAVKDACHPSGGRVDDRLVNAPTSYGNEGIGADGGFAVPPAYRTEIMSKVTGDDQLIARCDQNDTPSNSLVVPKDETTPWGTTGIQAYWDGEASAYTQKKPALEQTTIKLNKLTALVPVTDEQLEDAPSMGRYVQRKAPEVMQFKVSDAIVRGNGAGMPLGILNSGCLVTQTKEVSQAAATILGANVIKMYSRMYAPWLSSAIWLINQDTYPQLMALNIPIKNVAGTENVGGVPVFVPPGGLAQAPHGTLLGRPIVPVQSCSTLGTVGDITFAALGQYAAVTKSQGIKADASIHLFFDYSITAFRFVFRMGGQPWWSAAISPKNGSNTLSPFVTLETRA
jgi:HK97 family phage major capsid protein